MKLKSGFVLHDVGTGHIAVATGEASENFSGLVRNNDTAHFIFTCLMQETTEEDIVKAMMEEYDAPQKTIEKDVHDMIARFRDEGFLDE